MDILKDKQNKNYDYVSRYTSFPFYYNGEDDKYMYGLTSYLDEKDTYVLHVIKEGDSFDSLANKYYGRPDYYWIICDYNRIQDPFIELYGNIKTLKIPSLSTISFKS